MVSAPPITVTTSPPARSLAFEHSGASGRARVAWTHITGDHVQSGFYILV